MKKTIYLPVFKIVVSTDNIGGGSIISGLKITPEDESDEQYNAAMDAIESIILAHACAGIDISTPEYIEGIETAVLACANNI